MSNRDERDPFKNRYAGRDDDESEPAETAETAESTESAESAERAETAETESAEGESPDRERPAKTAETAEPAETDIMSETAESAEQAETAETGETGSTSVKERPNINMYLPADLVEEMEIRFDELNARYRRVHGEGMEKNRHYYPALLRAALEDRDVEEILALTEPSEED